MSATNAVDYAISYIKRQIPNLILRDVFSSRGILAKRGVASIDAGIREKVIDDIVYADCCIRGGREEKIDISSLEPVKVDSYGISYKIPERLTHGKKIVAVHYVSYVPRSYTTNGHYYQGYAPNSGYGQIPGVLNSVMRSNSSEALPGTHDVTLGPAGSNVINIPNPPKGIKVYQLRCVLENDTTFNHIHPTAYSKFGKLCLYACQMYIFNELDITLDQGKIQYGSELGKYRDKIDSYSDAAENYETYLDEVMDVVFMLNDPLRRREYHQMITGGKR